VVHDQVEVSLPVPRLKVDQTLSTGQLVKTWRKELDLGCLEGELSGVGSSGEPGKTDNITSTNVLVLSNECLRGCSVARSQLGSCSGNKAASLRGRTHDLDLLAIRSDIVEPQLGALITDGLNSTGKCNLLVS
jgi:hypothetical protein